MGLFFKSKNRKLSKEFKQEAARIEAERNKGMAAVRAYQEENKEKLQAMVAAEDELNELIGTERILVCGASSFTNMLLKDLLKRAKEVYDILSADSSEIGKKCLEVKPSILALRYDKPNLVDFAHEIMKIYPDVVIMAILKEPDSLPYSESELREAHIMGAAKFPCRTEELVKALKEIKSRYRPNVEYKGMINMDSFELFRESFLKNANIDLANYRERLIERKVNQLMKAHNFSTYQEYACAIAGNEGLKEEVIDNLTVQVSDFFRNVNRWEELESKYIPELLDRFGPSLKVWSAGCGHGEEAYSLVMSMKEHINLDDICVYATDISSAALNRAKKAVFAEKGVSNVKAPALQKYFAAKGSCYQVVPEICSRVRFERHDLLSDPYPKGCHLIVCRNTLGYFTPTAGQRALERLVRAMAPHGLLFVGECEMRLNYESVGLKNRGYYFYEKV